MILFQAKLFLKIDRINDKKKFTDLEVGEPLLAKVSPNGRKIMMCILVTNTLYTEQQVKEAEEFKKDSVTLSPQSLKRKPTPSMVVDQTKANSKSKVNNKKFNLKKKFSRTI